MATGGKDRQGRQQRDRARTYQARQELHRRGIRRRTRDNLTAVLLGAVIILGAVGVQTAYFVAGPGAPEPTSTATPEPSITAPSDPTPSDAPAESPTPASTRTTAP